MNLVCKEWSSEPAQSWGWMLRWALFLYRLEVGRALVIWAGVAPESARCDADTMQVKVRMRSLSLGCQDLIHPMYSTSMTIVPNCLFIIRYSAQLDLTTLVRVRPTTAHVSPLWWNTVLCQR